MGLLRVLLCGTGRSDRDRCAGAGSPAHTPNRIYRNWCVQEDLMNLKTCFASLALALAIAVLGFSGFLQAQGLTGQISGILTDATGGVLPGATVMIRNVGTGFTRETVSGANGGFVFPDLLAGTFDLTGAMPGFQTYEQKGIELAPPERPSVRPVAPEGGGVAETVKVQAEAGQGHTPSG